MRRLAVLVPLVTLAACSSATGPGEWLRVVGYIEPTLSSVQLVMLPNEITAGEPFTVTVTTVGSSSCTRADGGEVMVVGVVAHVTPYDRILRGEEIACTDDLHPFPRGITVTLPLAGEGRIRIIGRDIREDEELTYEVAVTVRPGS